MKAYKNAKFIKGVVGEEAIMYDGTPHIAFVGRSNVGKSSTINALLDRRKLVKTGRTPGKTQEINFFEVQDDIDHLWYFVDLPGYGYAKLSKTRREELRKLIVWYLSHPQSDTALVCIIIDAKVGLTEFDQEVLNILEDQKKAYVIGVNKVDKINQKAQHKLEQELNEQVKSGSYVLYSAVKNKNIHKLRERIAKTA